MWEGNKPWGSMIGEEDENIVIFGGFENTSTADMLNCRFVALKDMKEVFGLNSKPLVINNNSLININSRIGIRGFVEDLALERVLDVMSDIVICEGDDLVLGETVLFEDVVGVVDVGLVAVVGVGVRAGD